MVAGAPVISTAAACSWCLLLVSVVLLSVFKPSTADEFDGWNQGRATYYGNNDGMSIHIGSCMFGNIDGTTGTGWDIAAISNRAYDYAGSCGRCYEVACRPTLLSDGYGQSIDRSSTCNGNNRVTVQVTDTCPCYYPSNQYSNTHWCCGDQYHMDLSYWAFQKLGRISDGVMGIYYRQVECPGGRSTVSNCNHNAGCSGSSSSSSYTSSSSSEAYASSSSSSSEYYASSSASSYAGSAPAPAPAPAYASSSSSGGWGGWFAPFSAGRTFFGRK